jgi:AsmA protein
MRISSGVVRFAMGGWEMKGRKILLTASGLFLFLLVALFVLLFFTLNQLIARNRSIIEARAEQALGRKVKYEKMQASLSPRIGISVKGLSVADDPEFSREFFFRASELVLRLRLMPLFSKHIEIASFFLSEPRVEIIRSPEGRFNFASIGRREKFPKKESGRKLRVEDTFALLDFGDVEIRDAEVLYHDRSATVRKPLLFRKLNLRLRSGRPPAPIKVSFGVALSQSSPDLLLRGEIRRPPQGEGFNAEKIGLDLEVEGKEIRVDSLRESISNLGSLLPAELELKGPINFKVSTKGELLNLAIHGEVEGKESAIRYGSQFFQKSKGTPFLLKWDASREPLKIALQRSEIRLGEARLGLTGDYVLTENGAKRTINYALESPLLSMAILNPQNQSGDDTLKDLFVSGRMETGGSHTISFKTKEAKLQGFQLSALTAEAQMKGHRLTLSRVESGLYGGTMQGKASYSGAGLSPVFALDLKFHEVDFPKLIAASMKKDEWRISGKLDADTKLSGVGKDWKEIQASLKGKGVAEIREGNIKDFNLVETVLSKTTGVAGVADSLAEKASPKYRHLFEGKETKFEKLKVRYEISEGKILTDELIIQSPDYAIKAKGWVGFDRRTNLDSTLVMSEGFSSNMVADHKNASFFTNQDGRLFFQVRLTGTLPNLKPHMDPGYLSRVAEKGLMGKALDRARKGLEKKEGGAPEGKKERPEREILRRALEGFLGREKL